MSIPIYVLSLVDAASRREAVRREFARHGLNFDFIDAIDGRRMSNTELEYHYDRVRNARNFKRPLSQGEIACVLGHRAIWRKVSEGSAPVALVCEDDLLLLPACIDFLRSAARHKAAFEHALVKLDSPARAGKVVGRLAGVDLVLTSRLPGRTTSYLLGRDAATALLAQTRKVSRPIDMDLKHYWEHHVPILLVQPQLVSVQPNGGSSIEVLRAPTKPWTPWRRLSRTLRYQWLMSLGRLRSPLRVDRIPVLCEMRKLLSFPE
jgi:glycosyl transferase family 25